MIIHKRFDTPDEYKSYFLKFLKYSREDEDIFKPEDYEIIKPFFDVLKSKDMSSQAAQYGFEHWQKCRLEYANELFEIREDCANKFSSEELATIFGFYDKNERFETDEEYLQNDEEYSVEWEFGEDVEFPMIAVGRIEFNFNHRDEYKIGYLHFISKKEFT